MRLCIPCFGIVTLLTMEPAAFAQTACKATTDAPADVTLNLTLVEGRSVFQSGEIVRLQLEFTSPTPAKYFVDTRTYDRSGRLMIDAMCLEPDTADPLNDYFGSGLFGFIGGGLGGQQELGTYEASLELNEWKSLLPGSYRLRIVSHRVSRVAGSDDSSHSVVPIPLASNTIDFQVVSARPAWQAEVVAAAERELDIGAAESTAAKHAARTLRFLGSEHAAKALARRFYSLQQPNGWDLMFGLVASPYRAQVIQAMKAAIGDPGHPITREFVETLALLEIESDPDYRLPPYHKGGEERYRKLQDAKRVAFATLRDRHLDELAAAVNAKSDQARALSTETLLTGRAGDTATRGNARQSLIASWDSLPVRTRNELIEYRWNEIGGVEMLPILRGIVDGPSEAGHQLDKIERGPALRRIYELSPAEGRERILRETLDSKGDIDIHVLGMLPDAELPQIEQPILQRLRRGNARNVDYHLIARYGSGRVVDDVKAVYQQHVGEWACDPQVALLRYLLRVDPDYGAAAVADALARREKTGCYRMTLSGIGDALKEAALQRVAVAALYDPSYDVVRDAADALARHGSSEAEAALWQRLETFHETWKGKQAQLRHGPGLKPEAAAPGAAESALVRAIATGQAWLCSPQKLESLKQLVSSERQREIEAMLRHWRDGPMQLVLGWSPSGQLIYVVGYIPGEGLPALKRKLTQLPAGTKLVSAVSNDVYEAHAIEIAEIESTAGTAGLVLSIQKPH